jgi:hypothetical protein
MVYRANLDGSRQAWFSDDENNTFRYKLLIRWSDGPVQAVIGLNYSRANAISDDPTVKRCCTRAKAIGFGALLMLNLFAYGDTDPRGMLKAKDPYGDWRDAGELVNAVVEHDAKQVVCAYGNHGKHLNRDKEVLSAFAKAGIDLYALKVTRVGECPAHPLYLNGKLRPFLWIAALRAEEVAA